MYHPEMKDCVIELSFSHVKVQTQETLSCQKSAHENDSDAHGPVKVSLGSKVQSGQVKTGANRSSPHSMAVLHVP